MSPWHTYERRRLVNVHKSYKEDRNDNEMEKVGDLGGTFPTCGGLIYGHIHLVNIITIQIRHS